MKTAYRFGVIHPGNIWVVYDCIRLTAEQVWALVEATLPRGAKVKFL